MHYLGDLTLVNLEKLVYVEVCETVIILSFDNGKEVSRTCESHEEALAELRKIEDVMTPKTRFSEYRNKL